MYPNLSDIPYVVDLTQSQPNDYSTTPTFSNSSNIPINSQQNNESDSVFMIDTIAFTQHPFMSEGTSSIRPHENDS